ncbi:MAG: hypothetical protein IKJ13_02585 [Clostridia bacterium]|nr:hypothetical protein [Clostridia bacterium]
MNEVNSYEVINNSEPEADHEIVFGISDRAVSVEAYRRLANQTRETEQHVGYVIYSDGKSVAVAYDGPLYGLHIAEDVAIKHFLSEYMSASSLKLENGYVESVSFDAVEYQNNADMEYEEKRWESAKNSLASRAGSELAEKTIEALKRYYAISDSNRLVSWLADLYDAEIGGFYYSNSGRNTDGFLPDIESTYQAIGFLDTSGLASWAGGVDKLLPDVMKAKIVNWIKGLQDSENGYFYHPQWGKATTDQSLARRGRDLKWAENLLSRFGAHPTYNTPNGVKGDGILADGTPVAPASRITEAFGKSSLVTAISRVIAANDIDAGVAEHLKNDKNFIDYLNGLGIDQEDQSYPVGNTLEAQASQIVARDKVLKERGVDYSLVDILYDFLCEKQNKVTGMWERDGSTDYAANNGLMKIGSTILSVGKPIPNADKALMGAFKCITTEQLPNSVCDVFNTWVSVNSCISSIETYSSSDPTMAQIASEMRKTVLEQAPTLIDTTAEKFALFVKEDGSFSFGREKTSHTSQGLPVAVEGTNEGDINATCIAILSTTGHIFSVLKINRVPLCTSGDMLRFLTTLENQGSIVKDRIADEREYATGNNYKKWGGDPYSYFSAASMKNVIREDTYIVTNVDFDYYEDGNKAKYKQEFINIGYDEERDTSYLRYGKSKEAGHYRGLYLKATNSSGASAIVFETDIKIDTVSSDALKALTATKGGYILNFKLSELIHEKAGIGGLNPTFDEIGRVYVFLDDDGEYYFRLGPALPPYMVNEDILGPVIKPGEWFNIAIEVYNNGVAKYYHGNKYICETDIGITPENFEKTNSIRFAFSPDAVNSAVHIDFTFIGKLSREYTKGDCIIDIGGFKFEAGEYYDNFGGYAYNSQPNGDSSSFFRHTSAGCWGETLDFVHSKQGLIYYQSAFKREGIAMIEKSDIKGQVSKVFEYCKGSAVDFYNGVYYTKHNDASEGGVFVFETDFKLEEINDATYTNLGAGGVIFDISLSDSSATGYAATKTLLAKIASVYLVRNTGGTYDWYFTNNRESYSSADNFGTPLSVNDWHTLTVEVYGDGIAKYYVDGVCIGDRRLDVSPEVFGEAMYARIALAESVIASSVLLDNTFFGKVDKDYEAHKDGVPESPKPEEPDVPVTPPITPEVPETPADRAEADPFDQTPGSSSSNEGWT